MSDYETNSSIQADLVGADFPAEAFPGLDGVDGLRPSGVPTSGPVALHTSLGRVEEVPKADFEIASQPADAGALLFIHDPNETEEQTELLDLGEQHASPYSGPSFSLDPFARESLRITYLSPPDIVLSIDASEPEPQDTKQTGKDEPWFLDLHDLNRFHAGSPNANPTEIYGRAHHEPEPRKIRLSGRSYNPARRRPPKQRCSRCGAGMIGHRCLRCSERCFSCGSLMEEGKCTNERCASCSESRCNACGQEICACGI